MPVEIVALDLQRGADSVPAKRVFRFARKEAQALFKKDPGPVDWEALFKSGTVVEISDTGAGMPPHVQQRIFEPFFTTKEVGKGTGQGLAIAHNVIVDKHGGTIKVSSAPAKGTTFIIRLPIGGMKSDSESAAGAAA